MSWRQDPERVLRALALSLAAGAPVFVLSVLRGGSNWQHPALVLAAWLVAAALYWRGELYPDLADSEGARRATRYCMLVPGIHVVVVLTFPLYLSWPSLWLLALIQLQLLVFSHVVRVRNVALLNAAVLGLGLTLLDEIALWTLIPITLALLFTPALDRLLEVRYALPGRRRPDLARPLRSVALVLALGLGAFAATYAALPPTANDYSEVGLLRERLTPTRKQVEFPVRELVVTGGALFLLVVLLSVWGRQGTRQEEATLELDEEVLAGRLRGRTAPALDPVAAAWPRGPRRALVEAYLEHLAEQRAERSARDTPQALASRLPGALRPLAQRMAARFARARWSPREVSEAELAAAREELAQLRAAEAGVGSPSELGEAGPCSEPGEPGASDRSSG